MCEGDNVNLVRKGKKAPGVRKGKQKQLVRRRGKDTWCEERERKALGVRKGREGHQV